MRALILLALLAGCAAQQPFKQNLFTGQRIYSAREWDAYRKAHHCEQTSKYGWSCDPLYGFWLDSRVNEGGR